MEDILYLAKIWWEKVQPIEKHEMTCLVIHSKISYKKLSDQQIIKIYNWAKNND